MRMVEGIFISKLQTLKITGNQACHRASKIFIYGFLQNKLHESNVLSVKLKEMYNVRKSTTRSNMLKSKCIKKDLKLIFRSFVLHLPF